MDMNRMSEGVIFATRSSPVCCPKNPVHRHLPVHDHEEHAGGGLQGIPVEDRMKILNAYYLPEGGGEEIYSEISPVNTFRVVLNMYFGGNLPLLEDRSYFSPVDRLFRFEEVP